MTGIVIGVAGLLLFIILMYNSLIGRRNQVDSVFATVDVMLKKRYDLIPNLVATVQGYMDHQYTTLELVTSLRTQALNAQSVDEQVAIDNQITAPLRQIMATAENYPDLTADGNFLKLQSSLNEVEEQISAARRTFNAAVLHYNNGLQMFPTNMMAAIMGLRPRAYFVIPEEEREPIKVNLRAGGLR